MKSWRTTIGGAVEGFGQGIRDLSTVMALYGASTGDLKNFTIYCVATGTVICLIGKLLSNIFAADNSEVSRRLNEHDDQIAQVKGDTTRLIRDAKTPPAAC